MRHKLTPKLLLAIVVMCFSLQANASNKTYFSGNDAEIKLNLTTSYSVKVVQVSFDANDGDTGSFQLINAKGLVVQQIEKIELIKSPNYFTINVSELPEGAYTFLIKTTTKTYTSEINIK